jgi:hypothetical protein
MNPEKLREGARMSKGNEDDSYATRNAFLAKVFLVVLAGGSGLALVGGGLSEMKNGAANAVLGLLGVAFGVALIVAAWRVMGSK